VRRDEARRPRVWFATRHPGGAGAPPGSTTRPCQELADDRQVSDPRVSTLGPNAGPQRHFDLCPLQGKRGTDGESAARRRQIARTWRAGRRPPCPATDTDTKRFAFFGAPSPSTEGEMSKSRTSRVAATMERALLSLVMPGLVPGIQIGRLRVGEGHHWIAGTSRAMTKERNVVT